MGEEPSYAQELNKAQVQQLRPLLAAHPWLFLMELGQMECVQHCIETPGGQVVRTPLRGPGHAMIGGY